MGFITLGYSSSHYKLHQWELNKRVIVNPECFSADTCAPENSPAVPQRSVSGADMDVEVNIASILVGLKEPSIIVSSFFDLSWNMGLDFSLTLTLFPFYIFGNA